MNNSNPKFKNRDGGNRSESSSTARKGNYQSPKDSKTPPPVVRVPDLEHIMRAGVYLTCVVNGQEFQPGVRMGQFAPGTEVKIRVKVSKTIERPAVIGYVSVSKNGHVKTNHVLNNVSEDKNYVVYELATTLTANQGFPCGITTWPGNRVYVLRESRTKGTFALFWAGCRTDPKGFIIPFVQHANSGELKRKGDELDVRSFGKSTTWPVFLKVAFADQKKLAKLPAARGNDKPWVQEKASGWLDRAPDSTGANLDQNLYGEVKFFLPFENMGFAFVKYMGNIVEAKIRATEILTLNEDGLKSLLPGDKIVAEKIDVEQARQGERAGTTAENNFVLKRVRILRD